MPHYVIVGNGIAGITAAQRIRRANPAAEIHVLSAEAHHYYQRPLLWKLIAGEIQQDELIFRPPEWYARQNIQVHLNSVVTSLNTAEHFLTLQDGASLHYDALLLTTGGRPFVPPVNGAEQPGVFTLRTLDDARAIRAYAAGCRRAAIIGGGLLGLETARAMVSVGLEVAVLEVMGHLLPRQLDAQGAAVLQNRLESLGIGIVTSASTEAILGNGQVNAVQLKDGRHIAADLAIISAGICSRIELAQAAGIETQRGIVVDEQMRTSAPDVWAAGDAAEFHKTVYGIIPAAMDQAQVAAANMINPGSTAYAGSVPSTTLKVVGIDLTCLGRSAAVDDGLNILRRSDPAAGVYQKLALQDHRVVGAILLGDVQRARTVQQWIEQGTDVSAQLNDWFPVSAQR